MTLKKMLAGSAVAASLLAAGSLPAAADILSSFAPGSYTLKFNNYENFTGSAIAPGTQNYGIFNVTSIIDPMTGNPVWNSGQGGYLVGVFNGITVSSVAGPLGGQYVTQNTGGVFDIYQVSTLPSFQFNGGVGYTTGGCSTIGSLCYNGITNTSSMALQYSLIPGAATLAADPSGTSTLQALVSSTTVPVSGTALGFGDVTGGTDAALYTTAAALTSLGTPADIKFQDDFCGPQTTTCFPLGWDESSQDPVNAVVTSVPEPASLALLGSALVSLGIVGSRRRGNNTSRM